MMTLKASMWPQDWTESEKQIGLKIRQEDGLQKGKNKICWLEDNIYIYKVSQNGFGLNL